jgi:hypothetical protein
MTSTARRLIPLRLLAIAALVPVLAPAQAAAGGLAVDLVFSDTGGRDQLCLRDGSEYVCTDLAPEAAGSRAVAAGDVDGDGTLDVVLAIGPDKPNLLCRGDGAGSFACGAIGTLPSTTASVALGDLNGDGRLDAVFGNVTNQPNHVCLNDGQGGFACGLLAPETDESYGVAIGDVDGDGTGDVVVANGGEPNQVCLGDGAGAFTCAPVETAADDSLGVALGDVNGDGKLDAVFANLERLPHTGAPQQNRACLGDGRGGFTCHAMSPHTERSVAVALGDLDGDGDLDAVFANTNQQPNRLCTNDGSGRFTCDQIDGRELASSGVALVDLDGNGALDVVFASACDVEHRQEPNRACLNVGAGDFHCTNVTGDLTESSGVAAGTFLP